MRLKPRKGRALSYQERIAKLAELRRLELLVAPLLEFDGDMKLACIIARGVWEEAPRPAAMVPLDHAPWAWMQGAAMDGFLLNEDAVTGKVVLFADLWHSLVAQDQSLEVLSGLRSPQPDAAVALYSAGLDCLVRVDRRYPLFVLKSTTYLVPAVLTTFANRLVALHDQGVAVDVATLQLARTIVRT
jgi:hypothetical protein